MMNKKIVVQNKTLIENISKILNTLDVNLIFNIENKSFYGYGMYGKFMLNDFHISVVENDCYISQESLDLNCRSEFIRWFNSYGGKELFIDESNRILSDL